MTTIYGALPSWNDGPVKAAIMDFVARVSCDGGLDYRPAAERIATFDNDGTLWCEQPLQVQIFFAMDRMKHLAHEDPSLAQRQPFKAFLEHDLKTLAALGKETLFQFAFETHAGVTEEEFEAFAHAWFSATRHPKLARLFKHCTFQPQIELLNYLREHGFKTFICSGGGIDLIRAISEEAYGIPREQVIGSSLKTRVTLQDGRLTLLKLSELDTFDDREVKVENIGLHIGRRPILAFGNSDGDLAMMRYALAGDGPRLALLLHHDDASREVAYDRDFRLSPLQDALDKAAEYGIQVVSMKRDWARVFPELHGIA